MESLPVPPYEGSAALHWGPKHAATFVVKTGSFEQKKWQKRLPLQKGGQHQGAVLGGERAEGIPPLNLSSTQPGSVPQPRGRAEKG